MAKLIHKYIYLKERRTTIYFLRFTVLMENKKKCAKFTNIVLAQLKKKNVTT